MTCASGHGFGDLGPNLNTTIPILRSTKRWAPSIIRSDRSPSQVNGFVPGRLPGVAASARRAAGTAILMASRLVAQVSGPVSQGGHPRVTARC